MSYIYEFEYTVIVSKYESEVKCELSPFSFFKAKNYTLFRIMFKNVYKIQFSVDQKFDENTEATTNTILYFEFLQKLKDELYHDSNSNNQIKDIYDRIPGMEEYLTSSDNNLVEIGIDLVKNFVQQIKKELGYDND